MRTFQWIPMFAKVGKFDREVECLGWLPWKTCSSAG